LREAWTIVVEARIMAPVKAALIVGYGYFIFRSPVVLI
jgi:hypothetical protein